MTLDRAHRIEPRAWRPITPPPQLKSIAISNSAYRAYNLREEWFENAGARPLRHIAALAMYRPLAARRWAIETGVIEGIYELAEPATERIVEGGLFSHLIEAGETNIAPSDLMAILHDHIFAYDSAVDWAMQGRPLTKWLIRALHAAMLKNQRTSAAMNQFGQIFEATLVKGEFKKRPNNPSRRDGRVHIYCPPLQVESALDDLIRMSGEWEESHIGIAMSPAPLVFAAWQHHQFQRVHPFQDGNGRVGRALLAYQFQKFALLPITVTRQDRTEYINALESADEGDLAPLVDLFGRLEERELYEIIAESKRNL